MSGGRIGKLKKVMGNPIKLKRFQNSLINDVCVLWINEYNDYFLKYDSSGQKLYFLLRNDVKDFGKDVGLDLNEMNIYSQTIIIKLSNLGIIDLVGGNTWKMNENAKSILTFMSL